MYSDLQRKVSNLLVEKNLLEHYEAIDVSYSNSRLKEIEENRPLITKNKTDPTISPTLTTKINYYGFCIPQKGVNNLGNIRIRKLTPTECYKLMGFSAEDCKKASEGGVSNSQLYKQAGNSIVVNVLEAIFTSLGENYEEFKVVE